MNFHVIAGMPRSGSTLLCNVLNQNPRFHASSTSCMAQTVRSLSVLWSKSPEMKSELITAKVVTEARMARAASALVEGWYEDQAEVVFDKCRHWNHNAAVLNHLFPDAKMFVCVRDLRDIFASVEKQHAKNPLLDDALSPTGLTSYARADRMFSPEGLLGQQIEGVEDLLRRNPKNAAGESFAQTIQYETFVRSPQLIIDRIYASLGEEHFEHDFEDVENTATDVDGLYNDKFPHVGSGKVAPSSGDWREHVPGDIAQHVMERFPNYNRAFGYQ
jgi:sulfotransferase